MLSFSASFKKNIIILFLSFRASVLGTLRHLTWVLSLAQVLMVNVKTFEGAIITRFIKMIHHEPFLCPG